MRAISSATLFVCAANDAQLPSRDKTPESPLVERFPPSPTVCVVFRFKSRCLSNIKLKPTLPYTSSVDDGSDSRAWSMSVCECCSVVGARALVHYWSVVVPVILAVRPMPVQCHLFVRFRGQGSNRRQYSEQKKVCHFCSNKEGLKFTLVALVGVTRLNLSCKLRLCRMEFFHPTDELASPLSLKKGMLATIQS